GGTINKDSWKSFVYDYRNMTAEERRAVVAERQQRGFPWHGPPHVDAPEGFHIVTGACFEHRKILDSRNRLEWFAGELLTYLAQFKNNIAIFPGNRCADAPNPSVFR